MTLETYVLWQNLFLLIVDLVLIGLFGTYVLRKIRGGFWRSASTDAGVAMLVYFVGMAFVRGGLLFFRLGHYAVTPEWKEEETVLMVGTIIAVLGATCLLRLFSDYTWQRWFHAWIFGVIAAAVIAGVIAGVRLF